MTDDLKGRAAFARNLRALRRRRGLNINDVARATGMELPHVSDLEMCKANFTVDTAVKLAAALQMPMWQLLKPDGETVVREPARSLRNGQRRGSRAVPEEGANRIG